MLPVWLIVVIIFKNCKSKTAFTIWA